jgi:hypothetical protein
LTAWASFPRQNGFANAHFEMRSDVPLSDFPMGKVSWPTQLGDFNLNLEPNKGVYIYEFNPFEDLEQVNRIVDIIGSFFRNL